MTFTYFEILVLRFIKFWLEYKLLGWAVEDGEHLHKEVCGALKPTAFAEEVEEEEK